MTSVFLLEPSPAPKRQRLAEVVSGPRRPAAAGAEAARRRLTAIRRYTLENLRTLARQFQSALKEGGEPSVSLASNVGEAIEQIARACGPTRNIAINKSALVTKELAPALRRAGFQVSESYFHQFPSFQNRFESYWQLPSIGPDTVELSLSQPTDLNRHRQWRRGNQVMRDIVAVLGVAAASAADGSLFLLQHGRNISEVFQQARKVVLVVGLDKLTAGPEAALFQTRCMAMFGAEAALMDLHPREDAGPAVEELPAVPTASASLELDIMLLDNGRSRLLEGPYREILGCINCRACITGCPTYPYFGGPHHWSPKEYVYFYALGQNRSLDLCLQCGVCRSLCPLKIDIPGLIVLSRSRRCQPVVNRLLANYEAVARQGSAAPLVVNSVLNSRPLRWVAHYALGLSKERELPRFQRHTLPRWIQGQRE